MSRSHFVLSRPSSSGTLLSSTTTSAILPPAAPSPSAKSTNSLNSAIEQRSSLPAPNAREAGCAPRRRKTVRRYPLKIEESSSARKSASLRSVAAEEVLAREVSAAAAAASCFRIESCEMSSNASLKSALPRRGWGPALAPARRTAALRGGCAVLLVACSESEAEEAAAEGVHDEGIDSISLASGVASPSDARRDVGRGISTTGRAKWNVVVARFAPTPGCAVSHARPPPASAP
mmetsp:Transcript_3356/g.10416  ORF Transcript_3356/g.10416 Transcript_3356/m.10416 type:complete len:234 (-) Transcript_3356:1733-2434(-)